MEINNFNEWEFVEVEKIDEPERYLRESAEILNQLGVKWCFGFGTAIGFYRDGDFPAKDTDVDVLVYITDPEEVYAVEEAFEAKYDLIRSVKEDGRKQQVAFQGEDAFIIDISFFYPDGDSYVSKHEEGNFIDKIDVIGSFMTLDTKYGPFPFPEKIEDYLEARYGDWKTPRYGAINSSIRD